MIVARVSPPGLSSSTVPTMETPWVWSPVTTISRIRVLGREFTGNAKGFVEFDGLHHGAAPVQRVGHLVDVYRFDRQDEAGLVFRKLTKSGLEHVNETRLIRKLVDGTLFEDVAIKNRIHIGGMGETRSFPVLDPSAFPVRSCRLPVSNRRP